MQNEKSFPINWLLVFFSICLIAIPLILLRIYDSVLHDYFSESNYFDNPNIWLRDQLLIEEIFNQSQEKIQHLHNVLEKEGVNVEIFNASNELIYKNIRDEQGAIIDNHGNLITESSYKTTVLDINNQILGYIYTSPNAQNLAIKNSSSSESVMMLMIIIVILIILFAFLFLVRKEMIKPIIALNKAFKEIANENHSIKVMTSRIREINNLSSGYEEMNQHLATLKKQRSQYENDRNLFVSSIVHDLRTPLFGLKGYLAGLTNGLATSEEKREKYIRKAEIQAFKMDQLLSLLAKYNRSYYLSKHISKEKIDLNILIKDILNGLEYQKQQKKLRAIVKIGPISIHADHFLLYQAIENIISNAIRFSPINGIINITAKEDNNWLSIFIKDQGHGIADSDIEHVLKPLYQSEQSRKDSSHIGLGLAISKKNIESHGGTIILKNREEGGLEVTLLLRRD
ncbi:sensor histidine kinase [Alkalihalobacillus pseudalcaliphilus]|uniref:sensor histidine kinase n=1 Tax=Alkalihalobacillus pseudalcaliphilus TaxID=79884 RepID=UPI00064DDA14|nr:HAMP domain-containing sensor histidine kinase [Alkalihalobacillus pseudalcaliphilus]KMK76255.1 hypothetical protein AB990_13685 [Alkalihalobacillus pseudalcaliphilus]